MLFDLGNVASVPLTVALVVPAGLSLVLRLRLPLVPLALTCLVNLLLQATAPGDFGSQTSILGVLPAVFTAASLLQGRVAWWAGSASFAVVYASHVVTREGDVADFLPLLIWGLPWLGGRLVRRQALAARAAGARAALLEVEAREATGRERDRIARELHDVVAHAVSLMVVQAGAERMALQDEAPRTRAVLDAVETTGRQALVELRTMLGVLRSTGSAEGLAPQPDLAGVVALVDSVRTAGLDVELRTSGNAELVGAGVGLAVYRVVQESLTNALRHGTGSARVQLSVGDVVEVEVRNPAGRPSTVGAGRGLLGMRERVELFGGTLTTGRVGDDWVVSARVPTSRSVVV